MVPRVDVKPLKHDFLVFGEVITGGTLWGTGVTSKRSSLLLFFCSGTLDQVTKLVVVVVVFSIGFLMGTILKIWKKRAPQNDRDLSGQKCLNFRGVLIGDKTDAWILGGGTA